ncbi:MAG: hypothetical protein KIT02_14510 [Devosia sp.]|uniref:hypothetical protein n=1 Tax=Devosia sp. TaxID=1871048 RepID=UPI0024C89178|nr:hypothetical protein [Devosia sp.]UYN99124.1 MAG: hypothetical protein KIT02_14510 [Devosia sp.]
MTVYGFEFPLDYAGQWDGFNDPAMEHFTGNPFQHLGREVPQNTLDAILSHPAKLRIKLVQVPVSDIPDVEGLRDVVQRCVISAAKDDGDKSSKFFAEAERLLSRPEITVLQIEDYNTAGVAGPCENGYPFFALLKATGQSKKSETSTGSYGIGKFAPFTVSALRTVFVSTVWQDSSEKQHHYVQGKSVLMSHLDDAGKTRRGTGFWGVRDGCMPVEGHLPKVPAWLRRTNNERGTTISILGFVPSKGWQGVLAANVVENFFGAIAAGELEVEIGETEAITAATLPSRFSSASVIDSISDQEGEPERFQNASSYLAALSDGGEVITCETENLHLGRCELRILVGENLPKRVAVLRNGMMITESMQGLKRFGDFKEFVGVLECKSTKGLALLRGMEPPRHDAFEPDRLPPDKRQQGRTALRELSKWVREMLQRHAQDPVSEVTNIDELADFFADEAEEGSGKKKDENPAGTVIVRARAVKAKQPRLMAVAVGGAEVEDDSETDEGQDSQGDGPGLGGGDGGSEGGGKNDADGGDSSSTGGAKTNGPAQSAILGLRDVRAVVLSPTRRRIAFTSPETGIFKLQLQDSGADSNHPLTIVSSSQGTVKAGRVEYLGVLANSRCTIEVELASPFEGTVRVVADAV